MMARFPSVSLCVVFGQDPGVEIRILTVVCFGSFVFSNLAIILYSVLLFVGGSGVLDCVLELCSARPGQCVHGTDQVLRHGGFPVAPVPRPMSSARRVGSRVAFRQVCTLGKHVRQIC